MTIVEGRAGVAASSVILLLLIPRDIFHFRYVQ